MSETDLIPSGRVKGSVRAVKISLLGVLHSRVPLFSPSEETQRESLRSLNALSPRPDGIRSVSDSSDLSCDSFSFPRENDSKLQRIACVSEQEPAASLSRNGRDPSILKR